VTGQQWVQFGAILAVVLLIPGPDFAVVVGHATKSRRYGAIVAAGTICGLLAHTLAASIGLTAVIASHPQILGAIRWTSAALLVVLGARLVARAFREHRGGAATESAATNDSAAQADSTISAGGLWLRGFSTNALNPKALLFFFALLPQFVDAADHPLRRTIELAAVTTLAAAAWWSVVVFAAGARWGAHRLGQHRIEMGCGAILVAFGLSFAVGM